VSVSLFRKGNHATELGHVGLVEQNQSIQDVEDLDLKSFKSEKEVHIIKSSIEIKSQRRGS
jgi:hypothetical protein